MQIGIVSPVGTTRKQDSGLNTEKSKYANNVNLYSVTASIGLYHVTLECSVEASNSKSLGDMKALQKIVNPQLSQYANMSIYIQLVLAWACIVLHLNVQLNKAL